MPKINNTMVNKQLRDTVFTMILENDIANFEKINDRQYGVLLTDLNGEQRYVRIGAIVAELREDMTAEELMQSEIDAYNQKQDEKEIKRLKAQKKAAADKAKREKKEEEENDC